MAKWNLYTALTTALGNITLLVRDDGQASPSTEIRTVTPAVLASFLTTYLLAVTGLSSWDEQSSSPSSPAATKMKLYFKNDEKLYKKNSSGIESEVGAGTVINNYLTGLTLSNSAGDPTNDIDIAAGYCADSTNAVMMTGAALTKQLDAAWAVGTNAGGLDTGSIANTTYHVWLIKRSDTGVVDVLYSTSASAPTMPTNYTYKRRIGSIVRTGAAIKTFIQDGNDFRWKVPIEDINVTNPGTSAVTRTLTLPTGIRVKAFVSLLSYGTGTAAMPQSIFLSDLSLTDSVANIGILSVSTYVDTTLLAQLGALVEVYTNTSAQIRSRVQVSTANTGMVIGTQGWEDTRGK
jgi:hypothetical protein